MRSFRRASKIDMHYNYVLWCVDSFGNGEFYIGYTIDLKARLKKHHSGATKTTRRFQELKLIYCEACLSEKDARGREKALKSGFGRGYLNRRLRDWLSGRTRASQA
ncbi:MAG: GIY-YIG nuclease family protein [Candidatus Vogelbacteria bacterium]|nr:GIY-YIG nuclease family protein [Candidatus Vogelbacteria bacterium]